MHYSTRLTDFLPYISKSVWRATNLIMSTKLLTYTGLLNDVYYHSKEIDTREIIRLVRKTNSTYRQILPFKGITQIVDYTRRRHVGISGPLKELIGYMPRDLMDNGLDLVIDIFQKDDFKVFNESIFSRIIQQLKETPKEHQDNLLFSFNYRMKSPGGKWLHLFQQSCYVTDPITKLPTYNIGMVTDITPFKKNNSMVFSIDKKNNRAEFSHIKNITTEYYYPDLEESQLTKREREVLAWLVEGFSSKQIAVKLKLSENTVIIHRKNMLKKTNTKNIAELVSYAIRNDII